AGERRPASRSYRLSEERADAAHNIGRGIGVPDNALGRDLRAFDVGRNSRQPTMASVRVGNDRSQRLIHLVCDRSRKLCEAGSLRRLGELGVGLPQRLLRMDLFVDVTENAKPLEDASAFIPDWSDATLHPAIHAVRTAQTIL